MTGMRNKNVPDPSNLTTVSQIMEICEMCRSRRPPKAFESDTDKFSVPSARSLRPHIRRMDESKFGILLCLFTGLRLGEICSLKWSDIDLNGLTKLSYHFPSVKQM